jgi:hypothetical protein
MPLATKVATVAAALAVETGSTPSHPGLSCIHTALSVKLTLEDEGVGVGVSVGVGVGIVPEELIVTEANDEESTGTIDVETSIISIIKTVTITLFFDMYFPVLE